MNTIDKIREIKKQMDIDLFRLCFRLGLEDYSDSAYVEELIYGKPDISETEAVKLLNNLLNSIEKDKDDLSKQIDSKQKELDNLTSAYNKLDHVDLSK